MDPINLPSNFGIHGQGRTPMLLAVINDHILSFEKVELSNRLVFYSFPTKCSLVWVSDTFTEKVWTFRLVLLSVQLVLIPNDLLHRFQGHSPAEVFNTGLQEVRMTPEVMTDFVVAFLVGTLLRLKHL